MSANNSPRYCIHCGNAIMPDDSFCTRCGEPIEFQDTPDNAFANESTRHIARTQRIHRANQTRAHAKPKNTKKGVDKIVVVCGAICAVCVVVICTTLLLRPLSSTNSTLPSDQAESVVSPTSINEEQSAQPATDTTPAPTTSQTQPPVEQTNASSNNATGSANEASAPEAAPSFPGVTASSTLEPDQYTSYYGPLNATDNDMATAWTEGVDGFGAGEWMRITNETPQTVRGVKVLGGYTKSDDVYDRNHRPRLVTISLSDGYARQYELSDSYRQWQSIDFDGPHQTTYVQLTIESVYTGSKWDDTCLSELSAY